MSKCLRNNMSHQWAASKLVRSRLLRSGSAFLRPLPTLVFPASRVTNTRVEGDIAITPILRQQHPAVDRVLKYPWSTEYRNQCFTKTGTLGSDSSRLVDCHHRHTRRFITENFELLNHSCLETYHSALAWLPEQSRICRKYATGRDAVFGVVLGARKT